MSKKLILMGSAGFLLYLYFQSDKTKSPEVVKFIVDGKIVPETELQNFDYYYYETDDGTIPSGYYKYISFPSGFSLELDKKYIPSAFETIKLKVNTAEIKEAHKILKQYYNGDSPLQKI